MIPGKLPTAALRRHVSSLTRPYSVDRVVDADDSVVGSGESYETDALSVDLYLYGARGGDSVIPVGEVDTGGLQGVALRDVDVRVGDRVTHGGARYEVDGPLQYVPSVDDAVLVSFSLTRVSDENTSYK